jgi:hypothetical protein
VEQTCEGRIVKLAGAAVSIVSLALPAAGQLTTRVSVGSGGAQADSSSEYASISADGRYVAFESYAENLVAATRTGE